jgi:hypothetical protein
MRATTIWKTVLNLACGCLLAAALGGFTPAVVAGEAGKLVASLRLESDAIFLHEPVLARLQIWNGAEHAVRFDLGLDHKENLTFTFNQPDGARVVRRLPVYFDEFGEIGIVALEPGQTYSADLVLNEWQNFDQQGDYEVKVEVPAAEGSVAAQGEPVVASARLRVTARDPARLAAVCKRLEVTAMGRSPITALEAAHALRFATDEVCTPSLSKLLRATIKWIRVDAIEGLASIGTPAAVGAVVDAWDGFDPTDRMVALGRFTSAGAGTALRDGLVRSGKKVREP